MASWLNKWFFLALIPLNSYMSDKGSGDLAIHSNGLIQTDIHKSFHPLHLSVTEINHNSADKTLEVSVKIFTDDFEKTLRKNFPTKTIDLINPSDRNAMNAIVTDYMRSRLIIKVDGRIVSYSCIGFEQEEDATFAYFEVGSVPAVHRLDMTNSILHDLFTDQTNINHIIVGGKRKSSKLDQPARDASFQF